MRKDHLHRRSAETSTNDAPEVGNGDPLSGSADPFDVLLSSKADESRSNGKVPSPLPDSDTENDNENDASKNENEKTETNGDAVETENGGEDGYEVEDIVDHKFKGKKKYFKIRWKNFGEDDDTWELENNLSCPEIIERYVAEHPDAVTVVKEKKEKKVRISLPTKEPTRHTPKRTAAERKAIIDDPLESDSADSVDKKKSKRGRPKKGPSKPAKKQEYEVQKIIDDELRNGKKYYRIRWKGWGAKDDTWEPKSSLSCPEIIKAYESNKTDNEEYEVEKIVGEKIEYNVRYFLVKWKGWPESDNSWETEKSVDCYELIEKFRDSCRSTNKSNKRTASTTPKASKAKKSRKSLSDDENNDEEDDGEDKKEWEVEKIINFRKRAGKKEYLIRWKGCKASEDTWEPENGINCPNLITAFLKKNKK
ncbi:M-phase phosphoprotein 8-like [Contarinia nasturtii]|uniref:M-phase phosphoprotein 8-like n=1 Tax=Contarinia nasturtii TaxID=265458 RepID=UPI0012D47342|nr:M-phase phosphoprotein 8-like [Contarinia nasturtii]